MNQIKDFRYKIRGNDVILYNRLIPAFTDMKAESELFSIVVLDFQESMVEFALEAERVDAFFFPNKEAGKSTQNRQLDSLLDEVSDKGIRIVTATAKEVKEVETKGMGPDHPPKRREGSCPHNKRWRKK